MPTERQSSGSPTVAEWLRSAESRLHAAGIESPRMEAQVLAAHILRVDRSWLFAHPEQEFNDLAGEHLLVRRLNQEPLAYLTGKREFFGRRFRVSPAVLIPRHETEILVEETLREASSGSKILDIGTGSGCIAITCKLENPALEVWATDISGPAIEIARENAETLGAEIIFRLTDLFPTDSPATFDLIVSNPPYIGEDEPLNAEVVDHEPHLALFAEEEGYAIYRRLAHQAPAYLVPEGKILLEVGYQQADKVVALFEESGWSHVRTVKDLAGIPRCVILQLKTERA